MNTARWSLLCLSLCLPRLQAAETVEEIVQKLIDNSAQMAQRMEEQVVTYSKRSVVEQLDKDGKVKSREETLRAMHWHQGKVEVRLLAEGRQNWSTESDDPDGGRADSEELAKARKSEDREERPFVITPELAAKYVFTRQGKELVRGRPCHLLSFAPREGLPEHGLVDRFMNRVAGRVWVDQEEYAVARAELHLKEPLMIWGGMLGALNNFFYILERVRVEEGFWLSQSSKSWFELRKLFVTRRYRTRSEWLDPQIAPATANPSTATTESGAALSNPQPSP